MILGTATSEAIQNPVSEEQVDNLVSSLKNNKALDIFGITAEHLKLASAKVRLVLTELLNRIYLNGSVPDDLKTGLSIPIPKKNPNETNPDKFRRITVTSQVRKVLEKHYTTTLKEQPKRTAIKTAIWVYGRSPMHGSRRSPNRGYGHQYR